MAPRTKLGLAALAALALFGCGLPRSSASEATPALLFVPDASPAQPAYRARDDIQVDASLVAARRVEPEHWEGVADQREGIRFELPAQPLLTESGYSLTHMGTTYEVEFEDVPESLLSGGHVPERFIVGWAKSYGGLADVKRPGIQSGVETRDFVMLKHGSANYGRIFWRPERRRMIVLEVTGNQANADRFLDSVTFF